MPAAATSTGAREAAAYDVALCGSCGAADSSGASPRALRSAHEAARVDAALARVAMAAHVASTRLRAARSLRPRCTRWTRAS